MSTMSGRGCPSLDPDPFKAALFTEEAFSPKPIELTEQLVGLAALLFIRNLNETPDTSNIFSVVSMSFERSASAKHESVSDDD